jgi:hypothetical protein
MATCECGCGGESNGQFLPGHDQRLRTSLEQQAGGLLPLRTLIEAAHSYFEGRITEEKFTQSVRALS